VPSAASIKPDSRQRIGANADSQAGASDAVENRLNILAGVAVEHLAASFAKSCLNPQLALQYHADNIRQKRE